MITGSVSVLCFKSTFIKVLRFKQILLLITTYSSLSIKESSKPLQHEAKVKGCGERKEHSDFIPRFFNWEQSLLSALLLKLTQRRKEMASNRWRYQGGNGNFSESLCTVAVKMTD